MVEDLSAARSFFGVAIFSERERKNAFFSFSLQPLSRVFLDPA
jgi:hypothetical protein